MSVFSFIGGWRRCVLIKRGLDETFRDATSAISEIRSTPICKTTKSAGYKSVN